MTHLTAIYLCSIFLPVDHESDPMTSSLFPVGSWIAAGGIASFHTFDLSEDLAKSSSLRLSEDVNPPSVHLSFQKGGTRCSSRCEISIRRFNSDPLLYAVWTFLHPWHYAADSDHPSSYNRDNNTQGSQLQL